MNRAEQAEQQVREVLAKSEEFQSTLDEFQHRMHTDTFAGTDKERTVQVTLNLRRWVQSVYIEDGLLRLGAVEVAQRLNDALQAAQTKVQEVLTERQGQLFQDLEGITDALAKAVPEAAMPGAAAAE